jgi:penicillin-binding protein A
MKSRITGLTVIIVLLFGLILGQAWFVQVHRAEELNRSTANPAVALAARLYPRGEILSSNGSVLAQSIRTRSSYNPWRRIYPYGSLTSDVVGYSSILYGTWGIEYQYDGELVSHPQPAQSVGDLISPKQSSNTVQLTLSVPLQQVAARALAGRDGAVVALDPRNGAVLAMYSDPSYNPNPLASLRTSTQVTTWGAINTNDPLGISPRDNVATQETYPPGSTFKVVTTAGILRYFPALANAAFPQSNQLNLAPYGSNQILYNSGDGDCGGTIVEMLPASCDPGYAWLGIKLGAQNLHDQATEFGYDQVPPLDLPGVVPSYFPAVSYFHDAIPYLAYSAIGQDNVRATALQNALVAAAIANGGKEMTPHLLSLITNAQGDVVQRYQPRAWHHPLGPAESAMVTSLMQAVVTDGTADGVGFLPQDDVAAKTGTAQTALSAENLKTDDWMIAFAPATDPVIAVGVVVPNQTLFDWGATVAGPIVKCVIEGALAIDAKQPPSGTSTTCPK